MTEELLKIFDENRKTPLEDKINQTIYSFENMFSLFLDVIDIIDNKLNSLQEQISSLETRYSAFEKETPKNQAKPIAPLPSPTPTTNKENPENPRRALIKELHDLFEKTNQNIDKNQK